MYHQFNSSVNSPSNSSSSNSLYYNSPMASSDYTFDSYNQQVASVQSNESYLPYQWSSKSTYDWSKYFYPNSYNQSPICASTTSISSNKSFDTSFYDLSSYNNSSFTNYSSSSIIQSTPSSSANQYQPQIASTLSNYNPTSMSMYNLPTTVAPFSNDSIIDSQLNSSKFTPDTSSKLASNTSLKSLTKSKPTVKRHAQLSDESVDIMNEWFRDHISNPYPSLTEKETLAQRSGITVKQVTAWFSNRRNRSQNTKPKRMKRVFEKEITNIFNEIICSQPNKAKILEKINLSLDNLGNQSH